MPFPSDGIRRISINNFGFGGSNAHAILDDAYHYLKDHGYNGKHHTKIPSIFVPSQNESAGLQPTTNYTTSHANVSCRNGNYQTNGTNLNDIAAGGTHLNAKAETNGVLDEKVPVDYSCTNGGHPSNGYECADYLTQRPLILPLSAADESGIARMLASYQQHFDSVAKTNTTRLVDHGNYLANLVYTLCNRRTILPWKSFAAISDGDTKSLFANLDFSKATRSSMRPALSYIFTGQGAQWHAMARGLAAHPAGWKSLKTSTKFLEELGCGWDLIGMAENLVSETWWVALC